MIPIRLLGKNTVARLPYAGGQHDIVQPEFGTMNVEQIRRSRDEWLCGQWLGPPDGLGQRGMATVEDRRDVFSQAGQLCCMAPARSVEDPGNELERQGRGGWLPPGGLGGSCSVGYVRHALKLHGLVCEVPCVNGEWVRTQRRAQCR